MTVASILKSKGDRVATTRPDTTVETVVHRLKLEGIGALVVSEDGRRVAGIVSERDIVRGLAIHGGDLLAMPVSALMTTGVTTCTPETTVNQVMAHMTRGRIRHLPVTVDGRLAGIVSIGDIVKHRLDEMELEVRTLRDYITAH
jgi:CBS domain-containing protein